MPLFPCPDVYYEKQFPDGRWVQVIPLTYGRARLCVGRAATFSYDNGW